MAVELENKSEIEQGGVIEGILHDVKMLFKGGCEWIGFFHEVIGSHGIIATRMSLEEATSFRKSKEYQSILEMWDQLKVEEGKKTKPKIGPINVPVRVPSALHESLKEEARQHRVSLNKLMVAKLFIPMETGCSSQIPE